MQRYYKRFRSQKGDTIVEVLIATAVVGLVLTGAYAVTNKSYQQIQRSQERSEANKVASRQMELLGAAAKVPANDLTGAGGAGAFCLNGTGVRVAFSPGACSEGRYVARITRDTSPVWNNRRFTVQVTWDTLGGAATQQQITFNYYVSTK